MPLFSFGFGFVGALIILRPGIEVVTPGALLMLTGSVFLATSILLVKVLGRTESPKTMVLMVALIAIPISAIPLFWVWEMPQGITRLWLACVGAVATGGHLIFNRAMVSADASAVLPYEYSRLIFAALIGFFVFSEVPDAWTWVGRLVIFSAGTYIANRGIAARKAAEDADDAPLAREHRFSSDPQTHEKLRTFRAELVRQLHRAGRAPSELRGFTSELATVEDDESPAPVDADPPNSMAATLEALKGVELLEGLHAALTTKRAR